jgi:hypothetical protein
LRASALTGVRVPRLAWEYYGLSNLEIRGFRLPVSACGLRRRPVLRLFLSAFDFELLLVLLDLELIEH